MIKTNTWVEVEGTGDFNSLTLGSPEVPFSTRLLPGSTDGAGGSTLPGKDGVKSFPLLKRFSMIRVSERNGRVWDELGWETRGSGIGWSRGEWRRMNFTTGRSLFLRATIRIVQGDLASDRTSWGSGEYSSILGYWISINQPISTFSSRYLKIEFWTVNQGLIGFSNSNAS